MQLRRTTLRRHGGPEGVECTFQEIRGVAITFRRTLFLFEHEPESSPPMTTPQPFESMMLARTSVR